MVKRKVSKERYFFAFLITAGIFALGLLLGLVIEGKRIDLVVFRDQEQKLDFQSLQLQYQFVDQFSQEKNCEGLLTTFDSSLQSLEFTREKIESYRKDSTFNNKEFDLVKREYTLAQVNYWLLYSNAKETCDLDSSVILYFFADDTICSDCDDQAIVLTWLKHKLGMNLLNFVFDGSYEDEPIMGLMKKIHNVDSYPTIVINGETFTGFTGRKEILSKICPTFDNASEIDICEPYVEGTGKA